MLKINLYKIYKSVSVVLLITCFFLFSNDCFSQTANKWQDQSDDLPGTSDNTWIYIAVGAVALGTLAYFIFKSPSNDSENNNETNESLNFSEKVSNLKQKYSGTNNTTFKTQNFRKEIDTVSVRKYIWGNETGNLNF